MSGVKELYLQSKELLDHLESPLPKDDDERDVYIEKINDLLDQREVSLKKIGDSSNLSTSEIKLGEEVLKLNKEINPKLAFLRNQIRIDISALKAKKEKGQKYENPYEGRTVDGIFFDKRE
ncbi:flagellar protein [Bacillus sp. FJAT-45350]|uniref:flagellar protein n=1 Tax=Bacillus sp. FJAT-45350 TaxID=2011014 RepID=UPI000BB855FE|nr:flagellar protein [Bacillus sp. FJAT-45350]